MGLLSLEFWGWLDQASILGLENVFQDTYYHKLVAPIYQGRLHFKMCLNGHHNRFYVLYFPLTMERLHVHLCHSYPGKSTIAREVFNQIQNRFGATCFLENTRKRAMTSDGTLSMQRQMLKDLCMDTTTEVGSPSHGKTLLKRRLCSKVVLIVLDDVDEPISVRDLVPISVLGSRSYVIITSHNEHSLRPCDSKMIYRVPHLSSTDAVRLFQLHAFGDFDPSYMPKMNLAEEVARACGGLPLALEVIGTELFRKWNDCVWKDVLNCLHKHMYLIENKNLMQPLRISFDMLDEPEKTMFLDIAHYFHGQGSAIAACFWEGLGLSAAKGLQNLLDRCLVKLFHNEEETILTMHDILQDLGRSLVVQENSQLGKRSRLLTPDSETVMTNGRVSFNPNMFSDCEQYVG